MAVNHDQNDEDQDGVGDACDTCPGDPLNDRDHDGVCDGVDYCPGDTDLDLDHICDRSDNCPQNPSPSQDDSDHDGVGDVCDLCPRTVAGASLEATGCSYNSGDFDGDGDVDQSDFGRFQACMGESLYLPQECSRFNIGAATFIRCMSGPDIPADPRCPGS